MDATTPNTPGTERTLASIRSTRVFPVPETKVYTLSDGCLRVEVGEFHGVVSSHHLVEPKENQLIRAYRDHHGAS